MMLTRKNHLPKKYANKFVWLVVLVVISLASSSFLFIIHDVVTIIPGGNDNVGKWNQKFISPTNESKNNDEDQKPLVSPKNESINNNGGNETLLSPKQSADFLKECMSRHNILWRDNPGRVSSWAGNVIYPMATTKEDNETAAIILGPLIPKVGSTTFRRMSGDRNNPIGMRIRQTPKPPQSFQISVVRHPLDHVLSIYRQIGFSWGGGTGDPMLFCGATEEEREKWFDNMVNDFITKPFGGRKRRNEHLVPQLHYLQNYHADKKQAYQKVPVVDRIDALLHLEYWDDDWKLATEQASQFSKEAHEWMHRHVTKTQNKERQQLAKNYSKFSFYEAGITDDTDWEPFCGEDGSVPYYRWVNATVPSKTHSKEEVRVKQILVDAQGNRLSDKKASSVIQTLRFHYARKHIWKFLPQLCEYLKLDFECLQYELPAACRKK